MIFFFLFLLPFLALQHKEPELVRLLNASSVYRVFSGHVPYGDSPAVISHPIQAPLSTVNEDSDLCKPHHTLPVGGLQVVVVDTSYSDSSSPDSRGVAVSEILVKDVTVTSRIRINTPSGPKTLDLPVKLCYTIIHGILREGTPYRFSLPATPAQQFDLQLDSILQSNPDVSSAFASFASSTSSSFSSSAKPEYQRAVYRGFQNYVVNMAIRQFNKQILADPYVGQKVLKSYKHLDLPPQAPKGSENDIEAHEKHHAQLLSDDQGFDPTEFDGMWVKTRVVREDIKDLSRLAGVPLSYDPEYGSFVWLLSVARGYHVIYKFVTVEQLRKMEFVQAPNLEIDTKLTLKHF